MAKKNGGKIRMLRKGNDEESIRKGKKKKNQTHKILRKYTLTSCAVVWNI